ncbi:hypothetical protein [Reyranella sp.]|uniref:hypothetical protein n=1 Tax=Reyranella sp. TaxID=1929291 RepID=UPI001207B5F6|nr:hypothetical protein [Reyranella sp.]TAJ85917.1 MAG: hypothetical protein EPO50_14210 [Reyranella sp.]
MCDYSLELYRSRPATEDEQYTLRRFPSGTMGFTAARDCETAVCIPADARLRLEGIGEAVQQAYAVGQTEEVVMTRVEGGAYAHKDAVKFSNGREVLLQSFNAGVTAEVIAFTSDLTDVTEVRRWRSPADLVDA